MTKETVEVAVDALEPDGVWDAVVNHPEVEDAWMEQLYSGDLRIDPILFERKRLDDYVGAMVGRQDHHLEDQVSRMIEMVEDDDNSITKLFVLVEGTPADVEYLRHSPSAASVRGSMAKLTALGVPVIPVCPWYLVKETPARANRVLVDMAIRIARKHREQTELLPFTTGPVAPDQSVTKQMYGVLSDIGEVTAGSLEDEFPTVADLVRATKEDLTNIDGIGEKTAESIINEINGNE